MLNRAIREAIQQLSGTKLNDKVYTFDGVVLSVDRKKRTCEVQAVGGKANFKIPNVRLMTAIDDGFYLLPVVDSNVTVILSDFTAPYVSQYSEIDEIILRGGELGGLIKIEQLVTKLNNIEKKVNTLTTKFNTHTHTANNVVTTMNELSGPLNETKRDDLENKKITHG